MSKPTYEEAKAYFFKVVQPPKHMEKTMEYIWKREGMDKDPQRIIDRANQIIGK